MRIAIVGSGISGVSAAWLLSKDHTVDLYEANDYLGGHTCTVDLTVDGVTFPVDTGFQVFNARTYPNLIRFFRHLEIDWTESDMSFSVQVPAHGIEWAGSSIDSVFAQRRNIVNPAFLKMLADVVRFSHDADRLLADPTLDELTLGELLAREGYSAAFTDWYLIPMGSAIWSTPPGEMHAYPAGTFLRFCNNHGLLHITGKPKWRSVIGGARTYIERAAQTLSGEVYAGEPVDTVTRTADGVRVATSRRTESYDAVVIAAHPPQTLRMLENPTPEEHAILGAFSFWDNEVVLHTDRTFMPDSRSCLGRMELLLGGRRYPQGHARAHVPDQPPATTPRRDAGDGDAQPPQGACRGHADRHSGLRAPVIHTRRDPRSTAHARDSGPRRSLVRRSMDQVWVP